MTRKDSQVSQMPLTQDDDLKLIHGIGTVLEERLHAAGIHTYAQLAAMTPEMIASALGNVIGLTIKRIVDQDWIGQAREFAQHNQLNSDGAKTGHQHYATFTVEVLLDENNTVRRTRAVFIQSKKEGAWAGWDEKRLLEFISQEANMQKIPQVERNEFTSTTVREEPQLPTIGGNPRLMPARITGHESHILRKDEPFEITLPFDLTDVSLSDCREIDFSLSLNAKALGAGSRSELGKAIGRFALSQENNVTLKCPGLKEGFYRIRVDLALHTPSIAPEANAVQVTALDGGLLQIY